MQLSMAIAKVLFQLSRLRLPWQLEAVGDAARDGGGALNGPGGELGAEPF